MADLYGNTEIDGTKEQKQKQSKGTSSFFIVIVISFNIF